MELSSNDFLSSLDVIVLKLVLEKTNHQCSGHVEPFLSVVVSVVLINLSQEAIQQFLDHVPDEIGLLPETALVHANVR